MGTFGDFRDLGFVATWSLARFCGPCPVDGVRAEEVLRVRTWTLSAIPPGEEILAWIWSTMSRTDRFLRCESPTETKNVRLSYHESRSGGQEQRSQWHGQQHCLAQKT